MWQSLDRPWREALSLVWEAFKAGTVPIGAVLVNDRGEIISRGRNGTFDKDWDHPLAGTNMAHAEMTCLFGLSEQDHPRMKTYTLYTSLEPCPMCFGTALMMNVRNIYYGADDGFAGASILKDSFEYIRSKKMNIVKLGGELEAFQLIIQSAYEYGRRHPRMEEILATWRKVNSFAIACGEKLYQSNYFTQAIEADKTIEEVYDEVIDVYLEGRTCPLCGEDNGCCHGSDRWCFHTSIPKELLERIPKEKRGRACVCKTCVEEFYRKAGREEKGDKDGGL